MHNWFLIFTSFLLLIACKTERAINSENIVKQDDGKETIVNSQNNDPPLTNSCLLNLDVDGIKDICENNMPELQENIPDEIKNLLPHTWTPISKNTLADIDPCPDRKCAYSAVEGQSGVLNDWTGGVFASEEGKLGGLVVWGGGHRGYYGNEIYFFDLQTLTWSRKSEPTAGQTPGDPHSLGLDKDTCLYYDGHPVAFHTYDSATYVSTTRQFLLPIVSDDNEGLLGEPTKCVGSHGIAFDFKKKQWNSLTDSTPLSNMFTITEFDKKRNAVWMLRTGFIPESGRLSKYDIKSAQWTNFKFGGGWMPQAHATAAIDPIRDLLVVTEFQYLPPPQMPRVLAKDLAHPNYRHVILKTSGDTEIEDASHSNLGFEWVPSLGKFVAWSSGSSLFYLTPPPNDWLTNEWIWKKVILNGKAPRDPFAGPGGKFQVAPKLGIAFVITKRTDSVYAVRLADPELSDNPLVSHFAKP